MSEEASAMLKRRKEDLPIDKGWAWIVLFACFCELFLFVGTQKSFGLLFIAFLEKYNTTASMVSLIIALQTGVTSFASFYVLVLGYKYFSSRQLIIAGGFFTALGYFLNGFARDVYFLIFSHGIIHALGCAGVYGPALVSLNSYFDKRKGLANSLASVGGSIGSLVIPLFLRYLLDNYGLQGCLVLMSGLLLNMITAGALMKPLKVINVENIASNEQGHLTEQTKNGSAPISNHLMNDKYCDDLGDKNDFCEEMSILGLSETNNIPSVSMKKLNLKVPVSKAFITESNDDEAFSITKANIRYPGTNACGNCSRCWNGAKTNCFSDLFLISVLKNHRFQLIMIVGFFCVFGSLLTISFIPPFAKDCYVPDNQIALLITITALCDLIGRFSVAWIADSRYIKRCHLIGISMGICGTASMLNFLYTDFPSFAAYAVVFGLVAGVYFALYPLLIVEAVGPENLRNGLAIMFPVHGISLLLNSFLLGYLRDMTGSYNWSFNLIGLGLLLGAVCLFCEPIARKLETRRLKTMKKCCSV